MNVGRAAGKNEGVEAADCLGEFGRSQAERDFDRFGANGPRRSEGFFVGLALVLKFFFSSAIRDTNTHFWAGFSGHGKPILSFGLRAGNCGENGTKTGGSGEARRRQPV